MARPKSDPGTQRDRIIGFRWNAGEWAAIKAAAQEAGIGPYPWLRKIILNQARLVLGGAHMAAIMDAATQEAIIHEQSTPDAGGDPPATARPRRRGDTRHGDDPAGATDGAGAVGHD
jgi:hypothetical protein